MNGLVIRYFSTGYFVCDGKPPKGCENEEGEIYVGNTVKWFEKYEDAVAFLDMIDSAYCKV